jgi:hypothetical protein
MLLVRVTRLLVGIATRPLSMFKLSQKAWKKSKKKFSVINSSMKSFKEVERIDYICETCNLYEDLEITEAEYEGKKVKLNDPIRTNEVPTKKFKVFVKDGDKVKVVRFGYPGMEIKRDDPGRRKSFRARHNCDNPGPKTKARYWSCFQWRAGAKVDN